MSRTLVAASRFFDGDLRSRGNVLSDAEVGDSLEDRPASRFFVGDLRSHGDLLSDAEVGDSLEDRPARGDLRNPWGPPEGRRKRGSWEGAWGSPGGILP